jgi:hypothetical protein
MATLRVWKAFEVEINGVRYNGGSRSSPLEISVTNAIQLGPFSLAASTTKTLWTGSTDELSDFDFLWIVSDSDIYAELTVDVSNGVGDELWGRIIEANQPYDLIGDGGLANYTANFATGTADVIDRLRVRNPGSSAATVTAFLAT